MTKLKIVLLLFILYFIESCNLFSIPHGYFSGAMFFTLIYAFLLAPKKAKGTPLE